MCGIAGLLGEGARTPDLARSMTVPLFHRGPDDGGVWNDGDASVALGHRRLAIVDLSPLGHQPMTSVNGRYVISYNGEIYNHGEIREELDRAGQTPEGGWRGHSDTETLLHAIACWGLEPTLQRCAGMFAFALWDKNDRKLTLVRDRFGEKPLYYGWVGGDFLFASELKAMRVHPRFDNAVNRDALKDFAARTYVPAPLSIYRRIFKLEPGCILEISPAVAASPMDEPPAVGTSSRELKLSRYWSYAEVVRSGLDNPIEDEAEALSELESVLSSAIRGQSLADVPVGAFLSGGIDSSTVVALYQKYSATPVRTYTIGFNEKKFNEADHAKAVAEHLGTVHHERYVTVDEARDVIPLLPQMYDEPFADSSQIPTFLVSRFAKEQVTVALSGDGGDELFAGYTRHFTAPKMWGTLKHVPRPLRAAAGHPLSQLPASFWGKVAVGMGKRGGHWGGVLQKALRVSASARSFDDVYRSMLDEWAFEPSPVGNDVGATSFPLDFGTSAPETLRMTYCDAMSYLPDDILCKVDRAAMAISLETRVPFLDHRVADIAARIPLGMKVRGGQGKHILRSLLAQDVPRELFERPKAGFGIPVGEWIKGPLRPWAEDLLDPHTLREQGWFNADTVQRRWRAHLSGQRDSSPAIWAILMFQSWLRAQSPTSQAMAA